MNLEGLPVLQLMETRPADLSQDPFVLVSSIQPLLSYSFIYQLFLNNITFFHLFIFYSRSLSPTVSQLPHQYIHLALQAREDLTDPFPQDNNKHHKKREVVCSTKLKTFSQGTRKPGLPIKWEDQHPQAFPVLSLVHVHLPGILPEAFKRLNPHPR